MARRRRAYGLDDTDAAVRAALDAFDADVPLDDLLAETAAHTADGRPATARGGYSRTDLVYALRSFGYRDTGNPGTPRFVRDAG